MQGASRQAMLSQRLAKGMFLAASDVNRDANVKNMEETIEGANASSHQRKSGAGGLMTPASDRVIAALATCESTWHEHERLLQNYVGSNPSAATLFNISKLSVEVDDCPDAILVRIREAATIYDAPVSR